MNTYDKAIEIGYALPDTPEHRQAFEYVVDLIDTSDTDENPTYRYLRFLASRADTTPGQLVDDVTQVLTEIEVTRLGAEHGRAVGSGVIDGNTSNEMLIRIIEGYDDGDPEIMDLQPAPLSGEWAGESIPELLSLGVGEDHPDDEALTAYELAFADAFWDEVIKTARGFLGWETTTI